MQTAPPEGGCAADDDAEQALLLPGRPWAVRLAGGNSACPALEIYQAGDLLDVVSSTRLAPAVLRGARAAESGGCACVLAWGRLPSTGVTPEVEFSLGRLRPHWRSGTVLRPTAWCWLAVADGRFDRAAVRSGDGCIRARIRRVRR